MWSGLRCAYRWTMICVFQAPARWSVYRSTPAIAQAVIAIENVRLFKELQARTAELTSSVDQLTALGEVWRAVSSTLDLATGLTTIVSRAVDISGLDGGVVFEYEKSAAEFIHRVATEGGGALAEARRTTRVRKGEGVVGQTALTMEPAQVPDITVSGAYESRLRENLIESGVRAILAVPMLREGELIGCLVVSRNRPGDFPGETIELLRTFATQSALAIQNARLSWRSRTRGGNWKPLAATSPSSSPTCPTSYELRSTPLLDSPRCSASACSVSLTRSRTSTSRISTPPASICCH